MRKRHGRARDYRKNPPEAALLPKPPVSDILSAHAIAALCAVPWTDGELAIEGAQEMAYPKFFEYKMRSRIIYGPGSRSLAGSELSRLGAKRVALFSDRGLVEAGIVRQVEESVAGQGVELAGIFDGVLQDARISIINRAASWARERGVDGLLAVGGGSVMDSVKAVNYLLSTGEEDVGAVMFGYIGMIQEAKPLLPHVAIPTTAGTGAEVSPAAVLLSEQSAIKGVFLHEYCSSDVAILDPELSLTLPSRITAFTGFDALTHAIEGATSRSANPMSAAPCLQAIRLITKYLPIAVADGSNVEARGNMLIASNMAIIGYVNSPGGAVHALAHTIGALKGVPHGLANALFLPAVMEFNGPSCRGRMVEVATALGIATIGMDDELAGKASASRVRELRREVGLPSSLRDVGIEASDFEKIASHALQDTTLPLNPRKTKEGDLVDICAATLSG